MPFAADRQRKRKRLNFRVATFTLIGTLALNALIAWGVRHYSETLVFGILAWVVGWGVDLPGMLLVRLCAFLGGNFFGKLTAASSDLMILAAIALCSGLTWSLLPGRIFREKTVNPVDP